MNRLANIPSCGLALLKGPRNAFDYVLRLTSDDKQFVQIYCHRCVLITHSKKMSDLICNENFWDMDVKVKPGFLGAAVELIQYMYLRDITLISDKSKILELCAVFEMPLDFFLIQQNQAQALNATHHMKLQIVADESESVTSMDFLRGIQFLKAKLIPVDPPSMEIKRSVREKEEEQIRPPPIRYNLRNKKK